MSYELEYKRESYFLEDGKYKDEKDFVVFVQEGSNNDYDCTTGKRSRTWHLVEHGWNYSVIQEICKRAGYCEGGGLTLRGKHTSPENYLRIYRKLLKNSKPFREFNKDFYLKQFTINVRPYLHHDYEKDLLKELSKNKKFKKEIYEWSKNDKEVRFITEINSEEDLREVLKYSCLCRYNGRPTLYLKEVD